MKNTSYYKNLEAILSEGEGLLREFKISLSGIERTMVAFANTQGGEIYIGLDDQGRQVGFALTNRCKAQIEDIAKNLDPPLLIHYRPLGKIVVISVPEGEDKPYRCSDGFFIRVGASNQKLKRNEILDLIVQFNRVRFESLQNSKFDFQKDFSKKFLEVYCRESRLQDTCLHMGEENFLNSLGVCEKQNNKLIFNHAGILVFGKNPQKFIPQANLNYTRYQGTTKTQIIDRRIYSGPLFEQLDDVFKKLTFDIPISYRLIDQKSRKEIPHYPMRALEEALLNAIIHRDYFEAGSEIYLDYFSDRIEIINPGRLLGSLTIEKIENKSLRRNPLIAELLYRMGRGEKLGSGIARMKSMMYEWNLKPPSFQVDQTFFSVTFFGPKEVVNEEKVFLLPQRPQEFMKKRNLVEEPFDTEDYAKIFRVTKRTAQKDLQILIGKELIKRKERGKNTKYFFR